MAETRTARLGLPTYSAGTDAFSRLDWDEAVADLDAQVLIHLPPGTLALRPAFGVAGRVYRATDVDAGVALFYDTGAAWVRVNPATAVGGANPSASAVGDATAEGVSTAAARADHRHAREAFGNVTAETVPGLAAANGVAATVTRSDHTHGTPSAGAPAASAPGDAQVTGVATTVARSDHKHAREAFGAAPPADVVGVGSAAGAAATLARSDHNHGLASAAPAASAPGDVTVEGVAPTVARSDHKHARESNATIRDAVIPAGLIAPYAGAAAPAGWLVCDGSIVAQGTYPALFAVIAHAYGGDPGGGNFRLPDYRGRLAGGAAGAGWVRGVPGDIDAHTHAKTGGVTGTGVVNVSAEDEDHSHGVNGSTGAETNPGGASHTHTYQDYSGDTGAVGGIYDWRETAGPDHNLTHGHNLAFNTGGRSAVHDHRFDHGHGDTIGVGAPAGLADALPSTFIIKAH